MTHLLDTNACIRYLNGRAPLLRLRLQTHSPEDTAVCPIVKAEMFAGALRSNSQIANAMIVNGDVKATYAASSYGALHLGLQKSNVEFKGTAGLYNIYTVPIDGARLISSETFKNTINGNLFGALSITYHFGSNSYSSKYKKSESYQSTANGESPHKVEEASSDQKSGFGPRNHAIFTNKKSRLTPSTGNSQP